MKNTMNNVLYGNKQFDEIKFPENYGDISKEQEEINEQEKKTTHKKDHNFWN